MTVAELLQIFERADKTVLEMTVAELLQMTVAELLQIFERAETPIKKSFERAETPIKKGKKKSKGPKKEVSAGVAAWNAYVTEVREELGCSRKEAMAEASKRRKEGSEEHAAASAARRAKRDEFLAKKAGSVTEPVAEKPVSVKPKKVLSPEHLAKMQAAAKAKREEKKAALAPAEKAKREEKKATAPSAKDEDPIIKTISGKKHLWNPSNNHCYRCEADGSQGEWAGLYDPKINKIDDSVEEPVEFEEELPLCSDCGEESVTAKGHRYCEACK